MHIESKAQQAANAANDGRGERIAYCVTLADGSQFYTAINGRVLYDSARDMGPFCDGWRIIGFKKRVNSRETIALSTAATGADIGAGHVIDLDNGSYRQWGPAYRRAVRVEFNDTGRDGRPLFEEVSAS